MCVILSPVIFSVYHLIAQFLYSCSETIDIHKPVIPYPSLLYTAAIDGVPPSLLEALIHNGTSLDLTASNGTFHFTTFIGRFSVQRLEAQRLTIYILYNMTLIYM